MPRQSNLCKVTKKTREKPNQFELFANKNATVFDNFTIKSKQYKKK